MIKFLYFGLAVEHRRHGLKPPLHPCVNRSPISRKELALINSTGVVYDAMGGAVDFIG
ncbi:MAG: hypothetical protein ACK459_08190 [Akkermansiaceae bacterium]